MNWKDIAIEACKKIIVGTIAILGLKAVDNVVNGKDILGRDPDPSETRVDGKGDILLGTDDYKIV